jgi:uncharacterized protein YbaR (Trm112 family)
MLVLFGALLIGLIGSETYGYSSRDVVNKGRYYCPAHKVIYEQAGSHQNCQPVVRHVVVAQKELYCPECNTWYPTSLRHVCPPVRVAQRQSVYVSKTVPQSSPTYNRSYKAPIIDVDIWTTPRYGGRYYGRGRYGYVNNYYGYGGYGRTYYNLSGRNYFRKWFGDRHHHRDHHQPRRHRHQDHHRGYGGYRGYGW